MDTVKDGWATISVRLIAQNVDELPLPEQLRKIARVNKTRTVLVMQVADSDDCSMQTQLDLLKVFLKTHTEALSALSNCEINVSLGWSPREPQESVTIDQELVGLAARINASFYVDTYNA